MVEKGDEVGGGGSGRGWVAFIGKRAWHLVRRMWHGYTLESELPRVESIIVRVVGY